MTGFTFLPLPTNPLFSPEHHEFETQLPWSNLHHHHPLDLLRSPSQHISLITFAFLTLS